MGENVDWPKKTREIHSHHFDSTAWNELSFHDDEIIVATHAKTGAAVLASGKQRGERPCPPPHNP